MRFSHLDSSELTDSGKQRANNEDAVLCLPESGVFCVADGMGGAADGEIASRAVVDALEEAFSGRHSGQEPDFTRTKELVFEAALNANAWIKDHADRRGASGAGSTVVILAFDPVASGNAAVFHAGDSRAYRLRGDTLMRLTKDHSLVSEAGLDDRDNLGPMFRAMVTRAVGIRASVDLEHSPVDVLSEDLFLLCSDGVTTMIPDDALGILLRANRTAGTKELCRILVDEANRRGGDDNITVVIIRAGKVATAAVAPEVAAEPAPAPVAPAAPTTACEQVVKGQPDGATPAAEPAVPAPEIASDDFIPQEDMAEEEKSQCASGPIDRDTTSPSDDGAGLVAPDQQPLSPTSDLECVTPSDLRGEETTGRDAAPEPEQVREAPPAGPASKQPSSAVWIGVSVFGLAVVAAAWWLVMPPESRPGTAAARKAPAVAATPPPSPAAEPVPLLVAVPAAVTPVVPPAVQAPVPPILAAADIRNLRATMPTRLEGALQAGEWGAMHAYVKKWQPGVPDLLPDSASTVMYSSWVALWTKVRDNAPDAAILPRQYREEIASLCGKAGFGRPPEDAEVGAGASPELRADAVCRTMYRLQRHLLDNVRSAIRRCQAEAAVLGPNPSGTLADLWSFTGSGDADLLATGLARADGIVKDLDGLDKWLAACGESQIPLMAVRNRPAKVLPRLLQSVREQREALAAQMDLVPARVKALRQQPAEGLVPILDRIELLYGKTMGGQSTSEPAVWQDEARCQDIRAMFNEMKAAVHIVEGQVSEVEDGR
ncbi:MAG: protein phosphatase 2C domain-containing protein [bacterium]